MRPAWAPSAASSGPASRTGVRPVTATAAARQAGLTWPRLPAAAELATTGAGYAAYSLIRLAIRAGHQVAFTHATELWHAERRLHLTVEPYLNHLAAAHTLLAEAAGWLRLWPGGHASQRGSAWALGCWPAPASGCSPTRAGWPRASGWPGCRFPGGACCSPTPPGSWPACSAARRARRRGRRRARGAHAHRHPARSRGSRSHRLPGDRILDRRCHRSRGGSRSRAPPPARPTAPEPAAR